MNEAMAAKMQMTEMRAMRRTAAKVGALYIIGTAAGCCSIIAKPFLDDPDYLGKVAGNATPVIIGALLILTMGIALALMSVLLYPVLRKHNPALAIGYVVFRGALETTTLIITAFCWLISAALGRAAVQAGADPAALSAISNALTDPRAGNAITTVFFILGAIMFYSVLYRAKLVPRWISAWGLVSAIPYILSGMLVLFGAIGSGSDAECLLVMPMALQEIVLAIWLIAKGFNTQPQIIPQAAIA